MDSFLKSLLAERQQQSNADGCTNDCIVVVDNARLHPESWSEMPRRLRNSLVLESDPIHSTPPLTRKKKKPACCGGSHAMDDPCPGRWGSTDKKKLKAKKKRQPALIPTAAPAPPSCPQRQQSIEMTPHHPWKNSPSSVLDCLVEVEGLRMPKRQASVALDSTDSLPPPPMMLLPPVKAPPMKTNSASSETMLFCPAFSGKVKRSSCSLLDDDDESDSEDENTVRSFRTIQSY